MKHNNIFSFFLLFYTLSACAQEFDFDAKINFWETSGKGLSEQYSFDFRPNLSPIPNIKTDINSVSGSNLTFDSYSVDGYYTLFNNGNLIIDAGAGFRYFSDAKYGNSSFDETTLSFTTDVYLYPEGNVTYYGQLDLGYASDLTYHDLDFGAQLNWVAGFGLNFGYRNYNLDFDGVGDLYNSDTVSGFYFGVVANW